MADVGALEHRHPGVVPQPGMQLTTTDVDRHHPARAPLEQAVREPARGCPRVEGGPTDHIDTEMTEGGVQLLAAAADEPRTVSGDAQRFFGRDETRRLLGGSAADGHPSGSDVGSGPLPTGGQAPTDELGVEPPPQRGQAPAAVELGAAFLAALAFFGARLAAPLPLDSFRSSRARSSLVAMPSAEIWLWISWLTSFRSSSAFLRLRSSSSSTAFLAR